MALGSSVFEPVWAVLKALRAHDEALGLELDELRRQLGRRSPGVPRLPSKIKFDLPIEVGPEFVQALTVRLVTQTTATWEFWFGLLERYVGREGHARVPTVHVEQGNNIGAWVSSQRALFAAGRLARDRVARLEALTAWTWDVKEATWEDMFSSLRDYASEYGTSIVPVSFKAGDKPLGSWVARQRTDKSRGILSREREARLESVPGWAWNATVSTWWDSFERLKRLSNEVGLSTIRQAYRDETGFAPFFWVREAVKAQRQGKLSADRVAALESLGDWGRGVSRPSDEEITQHLVQIVASTGALTIGRTDTFRGVNLLNWVSKARRRISEGKVESDLAARLTSLPGWEVAVAIRGRNTNDVQWRIWYRLLTETVDSGVKLDEIGQAYVTERGERLGEWVSNQRRRHRGGRIADDRAALLEQVPAWAWDPRAAGFATRLELLRRFAAREGSPDVPSAHYEDGEPLGNWVSELRQMYLAGNLSNAQTASLEGIEGWRWHIGKGGARRIDFQKAIAMLTECQQPDGSIAFPPRQADDFSLRDWVYKRRRDYRQGRLPPAQIAALETLLGWRWAAVNSRDASGPTG